MPSAALTLPEAVQPVEAPASLSQSFRAKRNVRLRELIAQIHRQRGGVRILDLGGTVAYWRRVGTDFLREHGAHVEVLNRTSSELRAEGMIPDLFSTSVGDACDLSHIKDSAFDLVHSNSVIEHVGSWSNMKAFAGEARRVANAYYIQTPYHWFPIDPHHPRSPLIHWLPRQVQARLLTGLPISHVGRIKTMDEAYSHIDHRSLLDGKQFTFLFPDAEIVSERVFGLTKSMVAVRT